MTVGTGRFSDDDGRQAVAGTEAANQLNTSQFLAIVWGFLQLMRGGGREFTRKQTEEIRRLTGPRRAGFGRPAEPMMTADRGDRQTW